MCELLAVLDGSSYLARVSVSSPENVRKTKKPSKRASKPQIEKKGFSLIEILSPCPHLLADGCKRIDEIH